MTEYANTLCESIITFHQDLLFTSLDYTSLWFQVGLGRYDNEVNIEIAVTNIFDPRPLQMSIHIWLQRYQLV